MANALINGIVKAFEDNAYAKQIEASAASTILDGDVFLSTYGADRISYIADRICRFVDCEWSVNDGAEGNILLDINDGTDFCLDEIAFPIPKPRIEWRDPAHGDGRDVSRSKYENREIRLTLQIFGTNEADLSTNARALWAMLAENSILAWKPSGWVDTLYFDLISPALEINTPDWFETWIRENKLCVMSNVEIVLEAKPFARAAEETVTLLNGTATPNGVAGMVISPTAFKGDAPAPADIFIDLVAGTRWTDLIFGQRLNYSPAFQPIRQPTVGTPHALASRLSGDYYSIAPRVDLLDDGIFAQHGATSGNTTDWDHWTELRNGGTAWMSTEASPVYTGTHSVKVGNSGATSHVGLSLTSDSVPVFIAKTYFVQLVYGQSTYTSATFTLRVMFYNGGAYLGKKDIAAGGPTTSWKSLEGYVSPADFPAATTHIKVYLALYTSGQYGKPHYAYFGQAVFAECVGGTIQAEYLLSSHEGRYLPTSSISFDASAAYDDVTLQALLATSAGVELTPSISPQVIDPGNPIANWVDMSMLPVSARPSVLSIPSHRISNLADKSDIEQIIRLSIDPLNAEDFWYDYIALVPIDRAYSEVRNWANSDHLILDGRSSQLALQSLTGTLDDAMIFPLNSQKGDCGFVADPDGFNGTILALTNVDGDYQVTSVVDVTMKYCPLYLIVPEG